MTVYGHVGVLTGPWTPPPAAAPAPPYVSRRRERRRGISYCICCLRPKYDRLLVEDLIRKTTDPYEILLWINTPDPSVEELARRKAAEGAPVRVVGSTPWNIGMAGFRELFRAARHEMIVQLDDDVVCVSPRIAETASEIFARRPEVRQLVADVVQDEWTNGARPPMDRYSPYAPSDGLHDGPIDGWFSVYRRAILHVLLEAPYEKYFYLGSWVRARLSQLGLRGLLCRRMKVFHATGPAYAAHFGALSDEVRKYREVGRQDMAQLYSGSRFSEEDIRRMGARYEEIKRELEAPPG